MPRGQGVSLLAATHRPVHSSADSAGHVMGTLGPAARAVAVAGLLSERALQTARALTCHRPFHSESSPAAPGEQMAPLAQGQSWGQKRGPSTPDPMRFHLHPCSPPPLSR